MNMQATEIKEIDFRKINKNEPKWLYNLRKNSWSNYSETGLPERVVHLWKYTDPGQFLVENPRDIMDISHPGADSLPKLSLKPEISGYGYNTADYLTVAVLDEQLARAGVIFKDLHAAVREDENIVGNYLGHLIDGSFGKFEAINSALWNSGLFLYIPDNTIVEKPIRLHRHSSDRTTFLRLLVVVGKNSDVTIIDDYSGECHKSDSLCNSVAELFVDESANVRYANIQRFGEGCRSHITQRARIGANGRLHSVYAGLGGSVSKVNAGTILAGRGADSKMSGVVFSGGKEHFDYHTRHHHQSSDSFSDIDFKVILKDYGVSAYTGLIKIDEDAQNCEAYQMNRNLLLNKGAKAESIPELEILCDQVRCSHGSTTGPIDPEMLFYLKSRGFSHNDAVRSVIMGFVEPTLTQIPDDLGEIIRNLMVQKLEG